jgi:hypothetical protein
MKNILREKADLTRTNIVDKNSSALWRHGKLFVYKYFDKVKWTNQILCYNLQAKLNYYRIKTINGSRKIPKNVAKWKITTKKMTTSAV